MKPLVTTKRVLTWLCMCPANESTSINMKICHISFAFVVFISNLSYIAAALISFSEFVFVDVERSLYPMMESMEILVVVYGAMVTFPMRQKINAIFDELTAIYDASEYIEK